ncbi:DNA polymerase III subunit beta [Paenarthrobacter nicotinovorans]|uniref:DNA polymerase III subunit beta n=1 Tax=Paenarthrobacter nicotinovorans TaxID=29320 RepID=UPI0024864F7C|nr:DNA polymerase III subunit beta [Paenarthrobacter nicotinovorans]MDI2019723.1 Beta sliding clamp [Paenarthrobacter nicotinovorans]
MTITATEPTTTTKPALADLEVTAAGTEWLRKLAAVGVAVSSRPPVPVLSFMVVECNRGKATLTGYDYSTSAVAKLNHETVGTLHNAKALVPFQWLVRTIRVLTLRKRDMPVTVASKDLLGQRLTTVTAAGYTIPFLHSIPLAEYPALPEHGLLDTFSLDRADLAGALDRATVAASVDDTLPILTSIRLNCTGKMLSMWATDRYRLSTETLQLPKSVQEFTFLLQASKWKAMAKHLVGEEITIGVLAEGDVAGRSGGWSTLQVSSDDVAFTLSPVGGDYPKIDALFEEDYGQTLEVNRRDLLDQVLVARELNERNVPALVKIGPGSITASPSFHEGADQSATPLLLADTTNIDQPATVAYNPHYLLDAIKAVKAEVIRFSFYSLPKPVCLSPVSEKGKKQSTYRHLIMPVRVPNDYLGGE